MTLAFAAISRVADGDGTDATQVSADFNSIAHVGFRLSLIQGGDPNSSRQKRFIDADFVTPFALPIVLVSFGWLSNTRGFERARTQRARDRSRSGPVDGPSDPWNGRPYG